MSDQKFSCQGCDRTDLTLTANGKVRSHAANGKRTSEDNPACGYGSEYPTESTSFHTHVFDGHNDHQELSCVCGRVAPPSAFPLQEDPDDPLPEEGLASDPARHVPPNPFRDPLPGGVWDSLPHDRDSEDPSTAARAGAPVETLPSVNPPSDQSSAESFMDGNEDEDDEGESTRDSKRYFPAKYDGTCVTCLEHFDEGDMITRTPDGKWEAEDCCGEGAVPRPEVPKAVARTLPVVNGRYRLPHPETGKTIGGQRASKFAEGIADSYALDQWRGRMIILGLALSPDLVEKATGALRNGNPSEVARSKREYLNGLADKAKDAAGSKDRAGKGTKLHKYTEELDGGTRSLAEVPEEYRTDAEAYLKALEDAGFRPVKGLIERSAYSSELGVCGTFDRILECVRDTETVDLDGRPVQIRAGEFVIGDVKSGDNIEHPWLEILIQESIYAHAVNENGIAVQDTPGGPFRWVSLAETGAAKVREDVGIVMHVPYGSGRCSLYFADLVTGWRGALICKSNREFWKIKLPKQPVMSVRAEETPAPRNLMDAVHQATQEAKKDPGFTPPTASTVRIPEPESPRSYGWDEIFSAARTREEANSAWLRAKREGFSGDEIKRLVSLVNLDQEPEPVPAPVVPAPEQEVPKKPETPPVPAQKPDGPTLTQRARSVTTKAEASAVFKEAKALVDAMEGDKKTKAREYLDTLVVTMKERLAAV